MALAKQARVGWHGFDNKPTFKDCVEAIEKLGRKDKQPTGVS